eukprot:TRINITY_DN2367_c0_g1_i4.p1 TRINITY_DN2367_c0_g1~~TRINITY_DN2367_c0_g1_i4.p1  ORF type:complete len:509 (-),score=158.42 TRINITY_DN2367_c0_g1_i4:125-1585(-)
MSFQTKKKTSSVSLSESVDQPTYDIQSQDLYDNPHEELKQKFRVVRLPPFTYMHILNKNTNIIRAECGPLQYTCLEHERVIFGPTKMILLPPRTYCVIENPVLRNVKDEERGHDFATGEVVMDANKQAKLRYGEREVRVRDDQHLVEPFILYPGEKLLVSPTPLQVVEEGTALRLRALTDFLDKREGKKNVDGEKKEKLFINLQEGVKREAGEEWLFKGPGTYIPQPQEEVVEVVKSYFLDPLRALKLSARKNLVDSKGVERKLGEEWLMTGEGPYLPLVDEVVVSEERAQILTDKTAFHVRATKSFVDKNGKERTAGEEWLVTNKDDQIYMPGVNELIITAVSLITLDNTKYCIINDPVDETGKQNFGSYKIVRGPANFFLKPGESPGAGIQQILVLGEDEGLVLKNKTTFVDASGKRKKAGQKWFIHGPCEFIAPPEVMVVTKKRALIQLEGLGIYLFDSQIIAGFVCLLVLLLAIFLYSRLRF